MEIRDALNTVAAMSDEELADCRDTTDLAIKRLQWEFMDTQGLLKDLVRKGVLDASRDCLQKHFSIARTLLLVERASMAPGGKVKRK